MSFEIEGQKNVTKANLRHFSFRLLLLACNKTSRKREKKGRRRGKWRGEWIEGEGIKSTQRQTLFETTPDEGVGQMERKRGLSKPKTEGRLHVWGYTTIFFVEKWPHLPGIQWQRERCKGRRDKEQSQTNRGKEEVSWEWMQSKRKNSDHHHDPEEGKRPDWLLCVLCTHRWERDRFLLIFREKKERKEDG